MTDYKFVDKSKIDVNILLINKYIKFCFLKTNLRTLITSSER